MANVTNIREFGNQLAVSFDDGTRQLAYPTGGGLWIISGAGGSDSGPGGPGGGPYAVIFPCAEHRISDSFAAHVARHSVNPGTDYIASYGSQVWAVAAGVVTDVTTTIDGSGGRMVHIDHTDGTSADYLHLSTIEVANGDSITQGQPIAHSGASGGTGAPGSGSDHFYGAHLHISYSTIHKHGYGGTGNIDFDALVRSEGLT